MDTVTSKMQADLEYTIMQQFGLLIVSCTDEDFLRRLVSAERAILAEARNGRYGE
jgi:hypothetical protein